MSEREQEWQGEGRGGAEQGEGEGGAEQGEGK